MANGWTQERRARQAEAIRRWRPWEKSTGPRTTEGKATASRNAYKGSEWHAVREISKAIHATLRAQRNQLCDASARQPLAQFARK